MNIVNRAYAGFLDGVNAPVSSDFSTWDGVLGKAYELLNFLVPFSALVAVVMIIVGGYSLMTAMGDPDKIKRGSDIITAAVVGMILVFLSKLLVGFIIGTVE